MAMTPLPAAPARSDAPATFITKADTFIAALPTFVTEANALETAVDADRVAAAASASAASTSASTATTQSGIATTKATEAAASAVTALNAPGTNATSTTSLAIGSGTKTLTIQTGKSIVVGMGIMVAQTAAPATNWMFGLCTDYNSGTGSLSISVGASGYGGSGTYTDWTVSLSATQVATGNFASLAGNTFTGTQIYSDQQNSRAMFVDCGYVFIDKGNSGTSTQTLDYTAGSHQKITATGNHTIATSNWAPSGNLGEMLLEAADFGAYTITFPSWNWVKPDGTTTTSVATYLSANTGRTSFQSSGTDFILIWSRDATTFYAKLV